MVKERKEDEVVVEIEKGDVRGTESGEKTAPVEEFDIGGEDCTSVDIE